MDEALLAQAKACKTVEELIALAEKENLDYTREKVEKAFARLHPSDQELADDELDSVAGGVCDPNAPLLDCSAGISWNEAKQGKCLGLWAPYCQYRFYNWDSSGRHFVECLRVGEIMVYYD